MDIVKFSDTSVLNLDFVERIGDRHGVHFRAIGLIQKKKLKDLFWFFAKKYGLRKRVILFNIIYTIK